MVAHSLGLLAGRNVGDCRAAIDGYSHCIESTEIVMQDSGIRVIER